MLVFVSLYLLAFVCIDFSDALIIYSSRVTPHNELSFNSISAKRGAFTDRTIHHKSRYHAKTRTIRPPMMSIDGDPNAQENAGVLTKYFIPGFVAVWAVGYGALFVSQLSYRLDDSGLGDAGTSVQELGERGGVLGVAFTIILFVVLVGYAGYEVMKPLPGESQEPSVFNDFDDDTKQS